MFLYGGFFDYLPPTYHGYLRVLRTTDNRQRTTVNGQRSTGNSQRTTVNGQRTMANGPHPDGSLLSVVYSLLTLFYQRDYTVLPRDT